MSFELFALPDFIIDETIAPLGPFQRLKIKLADFRNRLLGKWNSLDSKQKLMTGAAGAGIFVGTLIGIVIIAKKGGGLPSFFSGKKGIEINVSQPEEPRDRMALLDGVLITKSQYDELSNRRPLAVVVDNHLDARPLAGLDKADLVYEALVEGGITRFLAFFWRQTPESVGPVRSIRSYYLDWIAELNDALFMHIGGAVSSNPLANALGIIQQHGMKSLGISGRNTFWRVNEKQAPHNAYSSTKKLWEEAERIGWQPEGTLTSWKFKSDPPKADRPKTDESQQQKIKINWNGWGETTFSVTWVYDAQKNVYLREQGGGKAVDEITNEQLFAKNVILQYSLQTLANDGTARILYQTIGTDKALIFLDGKVIEGTWKKNNRLDRTRFYDSEGNEIEFNRGTTWVGVIPIGSEVEYE